MAVVPVNANGDDSTSVIATPYAAPDKVLALRTLMTYVPEVLGGTASKGVVVSLLAVSTGAHE